MTHKKVTIDWESFSCCILSTHWSRLVDFRNEFNLSQSTAWNAWHGKPIGLIPFLRICKRMDIPAENFLVELEK
jgi:hypothetical protein